MVAAGGLRVVFFGTPEFAVPTLDALLASRHDVIGVVTQPDRPRGRGQLLRDAPVKARASGAGIPLLQPERMRDAEFTKALKGWGADLGVVAAYGKILTDEVLTIPRLGMINVHASLLPRWRGAAPVHRAIIAGDRETGVTIMRVVKALDAGPMLATVRRPIDVDETSEQVERDLARLGARLLITVADSVADGPIRETPQDDTLATYAHRLTKDEGLIDWTTPARRIHDLVRGLHPWPHACTFHQGRRFIILRTAVDAPGPGGPPALTPGTLVSPTPSDLAVQAGDGPLRVLEIQAEGKRPMTAREFLAGHRFAPGAAFGRP